VKFGQLLCSCPATVVLQYQYCNTPATVLLLQVSATMPRGFKKVKLSGPMKVSRMRDNDLPLYQRQVANSEHGDEAVYDHAIEDYPAEEGVDAAGAEGQPSDTDDMFRPIDLQLNDDSWLFAAMGQGEEAEASVPPSVPHDLTCSSASCLAAL
jgi:hypothetical protein